MDNDFFAKRAAEACRNRDGLRARWQIPPGAITFLLCGKLTARKRPMDVLMAVEKLSGFRRQGHVLIVGEGPLKTACQEMTQRKGLPVSFTGFLNQSDLPGAYAASDVLVMPSAGETWGLVVNEAMACGLGALVSDRVGCGPDLIEEGVTGHIFRVGDVDALAARMSGLAANNVQVRRLQTCVRKKVQAFSMNQATRGLLGALDFVARQRA